jgi:AraC-like DNA-binding protein/mannose-6-phosphate isomerase-like protein (cupin superfamily)
MTEVFTYEPITEEIVCQYKKTSDNPTFTYHRHDGYEIYLFLKGNILFYQEDHCYVLSAGDLILLAPSRLHRVVSDTDSDYERIVISIAPAFLDALSTENTDLKACFVAKEAMSRPITLNEEQISRFKTYSEELAHALLRQEYGWDIRARICASELLLLVNECQKNISSAPNVMPDIVKYVMRYIQENLTTQISLENLAKSHYMSRTQVSRIFKKHTGLTLRNYILDQRIQRAKQLLMTDKNVSEACYDSGFADYSNFIRSFKKGVGMSPGQYKKLQKGSE